MSAKDVLQEAVGTKFISKDGHSSELKLLPPMTDSEIDALEDRAGGEIPNEMRELLLYARGFDGVLGGVNLSGLEWFDSEEFPRSLSIAQDGCGNFWLVDFSRGNGSDMAVFYACHDPPVYVFQSASLGHFISEVIRMGNSPWESEVDRVHEVSSMEIWAKNPLAVSREQALAVGGDMRKFAESLDDSFEFIDLRDATIGQGFSWGRYGAETVCKRFADKYIFAIQKRKPNFFQKIFGF